MLTATSQPVPIVRQVDGHYQRDPVLKQTNQPEPQPQPNSGRPSPDDKTQSDVDHGHPKSSDIQAGKPSPPPLLVLDLNGCLVHRQFGPGGKTVVPRPHLDDLFDYIFDDQPHPDHEPPTGDADSVKIPNWEVVIWSSAQPQNVERMCEAIHLSKRPPSNPVVSAGRRRPPTKDLTNQLNDISNQFGSLDINSKPSTRTKTTTTNTDEAPKRATSNRQHGLPTSHHVLDVWDRGMMDLSSEDYNKKVSTTKDLSKLWNKLTWTDPRSGQKIRWGPHNTVIIDDTPDKLSLQPDNLCLIEEFKGSADDQALKGLIEKLESIRDQANIPEALKNLNRSDKPSPNDEEPSKGKSDSQQKKVTTE